jgi:hypothetical protein
MNVQVLLLLPPLEQAPAQVASRPFDTVKVINVPVANGADCVLPTGTLMQAGLDVTRAPFRPVAVTVSVAVDPPAGVTVKLAVRRVPAWLAEIVTRVDTPTADVVAVNVALVAPAVTVTPAGTWAAAVLLLEG